MQSKEHWEQIYATRASTEVSWFQEHAVLSLKLIKNAAVPLSAEIIDVGGGASRLADDLLDNGYNNVTVLDLSASALSAARNRLAQRAHLVTWLEANILEADLPFHHYDVWHDRAVFHFLTAPEERLAYVQKVLSSVKPGGIVIVSTFAEDGPKQCSGLPVMRYSASELHAQFGQPFELMSHEREEHHTPSGNEQTFVYCMCRTAAHQAQS